MEPNKIWLLMLLYFAELYSYATLSTLYNNFDPKNRIFQSNFDNNYLKRKNVTVNAKCGKIRGKRVRVEANDENFPSDVVQFLGIPYAKPPVRELRWKKTVAKERLTGTFEATEFGPVCPQLLGGPLPNVLLPAWYRANSAFMRNRTAKMSEDCLYLNVYVPASLYEKQRGFRYVANSLPVMVYFHGHSFSEGAGSFYDGSVLASYGNVIVITFNYRLGVLGFLSVLNENAHGNYGLWDQRMVLKWVHENIRNFGGDPTRVTAFGSGAGAASIGILMLSVHTEEGNTRGDKPKGYFRRAILQSGSVLSPWSIVREPRKSAKALAGNPDIACPSNNLKEMINCLRKRSWRQLLNAKIQPDPFDLSFGPVVDGRNQLLSDFPINLLCNGEFINYEIIIGVSQADGFGYIRDRLRACDKCSDINNDVSYFASKALYKPNNFEIDVASFVSNFYSASNTSLAFIEQIVKFIYTDWTDPQNTTILKKSLMQLYTDRQWVEPAVKKADIHASHHHIAYFYTFNHHPGANTDRSWINAALGEEIPFVFGAPFLRAGYPLFPYNFTSDDQQISAAVMQYWSDFATHGNPIPDTRQQALPIGIVSNPFQNLRWSRYDVTNRSYLEISKTPGLFHHYRADKVALWSSFLPKFSGIPKIMLNNQLPLFLPSTYSSSFSRKPISNFNSENSSKGSSTMKNDTKENNAMDMQLSMTLAVGFVLLFVNIIGFAIVSYHKEKDKYKIEKLKSKLEMYQNRFSYFEKRGNGISINTHPKNDSKDQRFNRDDDRELHLQNNQQKQQQQKSIEQLNQQSLVLSPANGGRLGFKDSGVFEYGQNRRSEGPSSSIYSLISPIKHDGLEEKKQKKASFDCKMMSPKNQTNKTDSGAIYWSRSECGDGKPISGDEQVNFAPAVLSVRIASTLPKNSTTIATGADAIWYRENQRPRCQSALGMVVSRENECGTQVHQDNFGQHYSMRLPKNGRADKAKPSSTGLPRPNHYRSVQYLPLYHPKEMSPFNGSFRIPRPSTISEALPTPPGPMTFSSKEKNTPSAATSGVSSVTTKL